MTTSRKIKTMLQASQVVARIGELLQLKKDRNARDEARIASAKRRLDDAKARSAAFNARTEARIETLSTPLLPYFEAHRPESGKTVAVGTGVISVVEGRLGKTERLASDEAIAAEILRTHPDAYGEIVSVVYKIDLNALKRHPEVIESLTTVHVPLVDTLWIEPSNTDEKFRRPIAWFRNRLEAGA